MAVDTVDNEGPATVLINNPDRNVIHHTVGELFPLIDTQVLEARGTASPVDVVITRRSDDGTKYITTSNLHVARYIDGVGLKPGKEADAQLRYVDFEQTVLDFVDGYQPPVDGHFDVVYVPETELSSRLGRLDIDIESKKIESGSYDMPYIFHLEQNRPLTNEIDRVFGKDKWRLVPAAYEGEPLENIKRPVVRDHDFGELVRCAVLRKS